MSAQTSGESKMNAQELCDLVAAVEKARAAAAHANAAHQKLIAVEGQLEATRVEEDAARRANYEARDAMLKLVFRVGLDPTAVTHG